MNMSWKTLIFLIFIMVVALPEPVDAQVTNTYNYEIDIPASTDSVNLELDFYRAIIQITSGNPDDETLHVNSALLDYNRFQDMGRPRDSLQLFNTRQAPNLEIVSGDSEIEISDNLHRDIVYLEISVPPGMSIKATTAHFGRFDIEGVSGNLDLKNYSGNIYLQDTGGSISAQTIRDGSIFAEFRSSVPRQPAVLSTYGGNIHVIILPDAGLDLRMRTELGRLESEFRMEKTMDATGDNLITTPGLRKGSSSFWVESTLNKGGPLFLLQTIRGDIFIRRVK